MITYTSKKTLFVITALLCGLFTSILMAAACWHIHVHTYRVYFWILLQGGQMLSVQILGGGGGGGGKWKESV